MSLIQDPLRTPKNGHFWPQKGGPGPPWGPPQGPSRPRRKRASRRRQTVLLELHSLVCDLVTSSVFLAVRQHSIILLVPSFTEVLLACYRTWQKFPILEAHAIAYRTGPKIGKFLPVSARRKRHPRRKVYLT